MLLSLESRWVCLPGLLQQLPYTRRLGARWLVAPTRREGGREGRTEGGRGKEGGRDSGKGRRSVMRERGRKMEEEVKGR